MSNKRRYPGAKPFAANQGHLFKGREKEAKQLRQLIENHQLTVLYGRSGYGKSSLLNAAVLPTFVEAGYHVINVRLGAWTPESTSSPISNTILSLTEDTDLLESTVLDELVRWDNSLWYYTKTFSLNTKQQRLLFVFDQFEELFTYPQEEIEHYEKNLSELLKTRIPQRYRDELQKKAKGPKDPKYQRVLERMDIKMVIGIRSNRFHLLERLSTTLPEILQNTLELDALSREGARAAIVEPAADTLEQYESIPFTYEITAQNSMLDFLTQEGRIEGILLQMVCAYFEQSIIDKRGKNEITQADLLANATQADGSISGLEGVVDRYYSDRIDDLPDEIEETVKRFIEDNLVQRVGNGGMRLSMHQAQIKERFDIDKNILDELVYNGLLRTEPFLRGGLTYELTHDRLIEPVLKSKATFEAGEADRLKAQLEAEEEKRRMAEQLRDQAESARFEAEMERTRAQKAEELARTAEAEAEEERRKAVDQRHAAVKAKVIAEHNEKKARTWTRISIATAVLALATGISSLVLLINFREAQALKNLNLSQEYIVDARRLAVAGYCDSAKKYMEIAEELIIEFKDYDSDLAKDFAVAENAIVELKETSKCEL